MKKYIPYITAIIVAIIIGGSLLIVQINKQNSIERQAQLKIDQENKIIKDEKIKEAFNNSLYNSCTANANDAYWSYMELNGTKKEDGSINALTRHWDTAKKDKQNAIDNCYKQYK